ncbi:MAG: class I SAM-dependent methyltransferase [Planctomycetota bacterium]
MQSGKVLDMACGTGYLTDCFRQKGFDVLGCDILESAISIAKSKYPDCEFQVFNGRYPTALGEKCFDIVHMREFYPFTRSSDFEKQKDLILEYCRLVKDKGLLVIIGSNWCKGRHMNYHKMTAYLNKCHKGQLCAIGPFYESLYKLFPWSRKNKLYIKIAQPLWRIICFLLRKHPWNYLIIRKAEIKRDKAL